MAPDIRQYILLVIAILVPLFLLRTRRYRLLLGWVCITQFVQIFDTVILTNLPAGRIVGLLFLPTAFSKLREWLRLAPVRAWMVNYLLLLVLGILFGFIWPWHDITFSRPFTLTAPGRTIIYSARLLADFSLAVFVAEEILQSTSLVFIGRALVTGSTISAVAGLFSFITNIDLYYLLTGLGQQALDLGRARGLVGEPRALGLACAYGVMILLIGQGRILTFWPLLLLFNVTALLITYSASSIALFVAGILVAWLFFSNRERLVVVWVMLLALILIGGFWLLAPQQFDFAIETLSLRLDPDYKLMGIPPGSIGQEIAYRLDVFDACALLFLLDQPLYALIGTGPGLVSLPASEYVPPGLYSLIWTPETGINSPPYHGLLLEISNSGLPGLILWFVQVGACWVALRWLSASQAAGFSLPEEAKADDWNFGYALFLTGAVFYLVQVSYTPLWSLFLGIGWAAVKIAGECLQHNHPAQNSCLPADAWSGVEIAAPRHSEFN